MDEAMREHRRRRFRVNAQPGRLDSELIEVRFDIGAQAVTVVGLLPDEWRQVVDVVEQALRAAEGSDEEEDLKPCPVCEGRGMVNWLSDWPA